MAFLKLSVLSGLLLLCNSLNLESLRFFFDSELTVAHPPRQVQVFPPTPKVDRLYFDPKASASHSNLRLQANPKLPSGLELVNATSNFECSKADWTYLNHSYLAYEGAKNTDIICQSLNEGVLYRLSGGGSIKKEGGKCTVKAIDTNVADQSLCGNWIFEDWKISKEDCPAGSALGVFEDAWNHFSGMCDELSQDEEVVARVGYKGVLKMTPQKCSGGAMYIGYAPEVETSSNLCIVPHSFAIRPTPSKAEAICSSGKSLINLLEIGDNIQAFCEFIPGGDEEAVAVRISGGAVLAKSKGQCFLLHRPSGFETQIALCASQSR